MTVERFRPMGLGDIFDEAFDLYKTNFAFLFLTAAAVAVPLNIITTFIALRFWPDYGNVDNILAAAGDLTVMIPLLAEWFRKLAAGAAFLLPFNIAGYSLLFGVLTLAASDRYFEIRRPMSSLYRTMLRRIIPLFFTNIFWAATIIISYICCIIPILFTAPIFLFTGQVLALEKKSYFSAMGRSARLVSGYGFRAFGFLILLSILYMILSIGFEIPFHFAAASIFKAIGVQGIADSAFASHVGRLDQLIDQIGSGLLDLIAIPFVVVAITVFYYDLRIRKEAFDIEILARDLGYRSLPEYGPYLPPVAVAYQNMPRPAVVSPPRAGKGKTGKPGSTTS